MDTAPAQYALRDGTHLKRLLAGKNVVGRSAVPVEGVSFISVESPRAAVSRLQAIIEIAPNGDAWISDCNSTNGTFLAVNEGVGIRLEPSHHYQLQHGNRVVFGDVERTFVRCTGQEVVSLQQAEAASPSTVALAVRSPSTTTPATPSKSPATAAAKEEAAAVIKAPRSQRPSGSNAPSPQERRTTPYLQDSEIALTSPTVSRKRSRPSETETATRPSSRNESDAVAECGRGENGHKLETAPIACLSGMDANQRRAVQKLLKQHGGRSVEEITKANLLVVPSPAVRTPKFIIAVGRGIPVVSVKYLESVSLGTIDPFIVPLKHGNHTYTAGQLRKAIFRTDQTPLLTGQRYTVSALPAKVKGVAEEIVEGCGGEVYRRRSGAPAEAVELTESSLDSLYDRILRGSRTPLPQ